MSTTPFETAYTRLNKAQKQAVDSVEGPIMVVAGPGTGKTQILTLRIAQILKNTDTNPENILALTFTDAGAQAMRERLHSYIGASAYRVPIYTFHSFAERLIREYPDAYSRVIGGRLMGDLEKIAYIESLLETEGVKHLRPMGNPAYYVVPIQREIEHLKKEGITPDDCAEILERQEKDLENTEKIHEKGAHKGKVRGEYTKKEKSLLKNRELFALYRAYEALLTTERLYDFDDMITETIAALEENEDMLRDLQETYQYILADEHQDVNGSQNRILELLASYHESPNIFAVGDEKQAIYRFQGASLENFLYFKDAFSGTDVISLTENYRSGQRILDVAHDLVAVEDGPLKDLRIPLVSNTEEADIERRSFEHQVVEDEHIAKEIEAQIQDGVPPEEIAVIVRTNREVEDFALVLRRKGIAVAPSSDGDILSHPITQTVTALIRAVMHPEDATTLRTVLHDAYWGLTTTDIFRILGAVRYDRPLVEVLGDEKILREIGVEHVDGAHRIMTVLAQTRQRTAKEAPHHTLEYLLKESGFLDYVIEEDPFEGVRVVRRLYDEIEDLVRRDEVSTLQEVIALLEKRKEYRLPLNAPYIGDAAHAVQVLTAHKSKGREFDHVFVPHLVDSNWGGKVKRSYFTIPLNRYVPEEDFDPLDDERRLFYVAMTRARKRLVLSHSETNAEGRALIPSRLLDDVSVETQEIAGDFEPLAGFGEGEVSGIDSAFLAHLFHERGLSATALNNYLDSPWTYLYRNMLRVPEVMNASLQYGNAMHGALERLTKEKSLSVSDAKKYLETQLRRLPITTEEYTRLLERGLETFAVYLPHLEQSVGVETKEEFSLSVFLEADDMKIKLTGKLDRLDFDSEGNVLRVVDYKTGKPKTRGQIEGTTKDSNGDYKRQLVFYALMLSLYDDERYKTREGVISFVEPNTKGEIKEEAFTITDEEIEALKEEIVRVAKEITTGAFLSFPCEEDSAYALLVQKLQERSAS
ncbi:ATP-dependent helicase [Candidatus Kaiserbacteria bacterium]|nr:ATP-dependent helicase [Candidatus Kaiserbacteria bacterium]